jgi:hypothetical protein
MALRRPASARRGVGRTLLAAALVPLATTMGCYEGVALAPGTIAPQGATVRAMLTPEGTAAVEPLYGPFIQRLEGNLVGPWPSDSLRVQVKATFHQSGYRADPPPQLVTLPLRAVASVERRQLNITKTAMVGLSVAILAVAVPALVGSSAGGGGTGGGNGGDQP